MADPHYMFLDWPSLPVLATVRTCPLEFKEGHGGWSFFPKTGNADIKSSMPRVLLGFEVSFESDYNPDQLIAKGLAAL